MYSEYANEESDAEEDENALNEDAVAIQRLKVKRDVSISTQQAGTDSFSRGPGR